MAQKKQLALRKQELVAQLAESREALDQGRTAIKEKLNFKKKLGNLARRKPKAVFAGSAAMGLAAAMLLRRPRKVEKKAAKPLLGVLAGWVMLVVKPAAKKWLIRHAKTYALAKMGSFSQPRREQLADARHEATARIR